MSNIDEIISAVMPWCETLIDADGVYAENIQDNLRTELTPPPEKAKKSRKNEKSEKKIYSMRPRATTF